MLADVSSASSLCSATLTVTLPAASDSRTQASSFTKDCWQIGENGVYFEVSAV